MGHRLLLAAVAASLAGCAGSEVRYTAGTEELYMPVLERREAQPWLRAPLPDLAPLWVSPDHPEASSALTPDGEDALRRHMHMIRGRVRAWEAWERGE